MTKVLTSRQVKLSSEQPFKHGARSIEPVPSRAGREEIKVTEVTLPALQSNYTTPQNNYMGGDYPRHSNFMVDRALPSISSTIQYEDSEIP